MSWLQLRLDTSPALANALEEHLLAAGAVAVTMEDNADQPVLEPGVGETPLWQQTRLTGLFSADTHMPAVLARIPEELLRGCNQRVEILEDKDWEREWISHYQPMRFGQRLWVCPSWMDPPEPDAVNLLLDPGLAFGTGTHPTTALCLGQLEQLTQPGQTVVDYGCGSGILAVAALKLGAERGLGVDNDPQALVASRENARRNSIAEERFMVTLPDVQTNAAWRGQADVVVANILAGPLAELSDTLLSLLKPGGTLLLSGLLQNQAAVLCAHYAPRLTLHVAGEREDWVCLQGTLPAT
ncbi:50S ribosomal protein L11 methyltransferase [Haliea sp.]|jgi:ribosomal protein L11 methyltransferase|uniref:50S ribosomal protein L11 methyltransferase n=1 Tax=Haliea TaxID=475794 RepID=UPI000C5498C1|nr:50S ribosomal protein L11 methyltransferase [Haliea sp.]MAY93227.1 50S ribosomal protein L11 methyltransferase [Haliea sp.]MBK39992.1 50S ribosomal protein L11 methyltransferase [Haliea sp.]MBP69356.1 50S ribosomal protein L11 methyltransferase [Haliea sp.]HBX73543.1 50S ribosomal protein L11 methyltransferase [Halieaceae bacterium]|tara:strand:+ start:738 stop:1631 length:894 start_codon:yes stop_codon:yes gene_type:complete